MGGQHARMDWYVLTVNSDSGASRQGWLGKAERGKDMRQEGGRGGREIKAKKVGNAVLICPIRPSKACAQIHSGSTK
jgi:hypothetical protein